MAKLVCSVYNVRILSVRLYVYYYSTGITVINARARIILYHPFRVTYIYRVAGTGVGLTRIRPSKNSRIRRQEKPGSGAEPRITTRIRTQPNKIQL